MKTEPNEMSPLRVPAGDNPDGDIRGRWPWVERAVWTERRLTALEKGPKNGVWHSLIDKVYAPRTRWAAWEKVAANDGAAGVDKVSVAGFARTAVAELATLSRQLREGSYAPKPVKRKWIPKPGSPEKRPLGISTVENKVLERAVAMLLEPVYEREFLDCSYGFRPGRSAHQALDAVRTAMMAMNGGWVLDVDVRKYFDPIPPQKLRDVLSLRIRDGVISRLVGKWLKAGIW